MTRVMRSLDPHSSACSMQASRRTSKAELASFQLPTRATAQHMLLCHHAFKHTRMQSDPIQHVSTCVRARLHTTPCSKSAKFWQRRQVSKRWHQKAGKVHSQQHIGTLAHQNNPIHQQQTSHPQMHKHTGKPHAKQQACTSQCTDMVI